MNFRTGDLTGPDYKCSSCAISGVRLWRQSHTFLCDVRLLCAECAEKDQVEAIQMYAIWHQPMDCGIGNLIPARPTPEGDTFWGHTSGDVEFWYKLRQYTDEERERNQLRLERDHFCAREQQALRDWLKQMDDMRQLREQFDLVSKNHAKLYEEVKKLRQKEKVNGSRSS